MDITQRPLCPNCNKRSITARAINALDQNDRSTSYFAVFAYCEDCGYILTNELRSHDDTILKMKK
jgi:uncharacterized Zn finger protein